MKVTSRQAWFPIFLMWISYRTAVACRRPLAFALGSRLTPARRSLARVSSTTTTNDEHVPPWSQAREKSKKNFRARQHVNPLARRYQQPTILSPDWPKDVLQDTTLPLHLDIGCGRGGFLLEMAAEVPSKNYLGFEIRPSIFQYALDRVEKRGLEGRLTFVGCNANVDLDRILSLYEGPIDMSRSSSRTPISNRSTRNAEW